MKISRRTFLKLGATAGLGLTGFLGAGRSLHASAPDEIAFGMVTDVHYADKDMRINRYYRGSIAKLEQCVGAFNESNLAFAVMLGDCILDANFRRDETASDAGNFKRAPTPRSTASIILP